MIIITHTHTVGSFLMRTTAVSRWGSFQPTMWKRTPLTTADVASEETVTWLYKLLHIQHTVMYGWDLWVGFM